MGACPVVSPVVSRLLLEYGWGYADEFDRELIAYIRSGCFSKSRISYCVEQAKTLLANEQAHEALEAGWSAYHRSLKNNEEEVIASIVASNMKYPEFVSPVNLDAAVRLLRDLNAGPASGPAHRNIRRRQQGQQEDTRGLQCLAHFARKGRSAINPARDLLRLGRSDLRLTQFRRRGRIDFRQLRAQATLFCPHAIDPRHGDQCAE
jgi:hypothetical protein